MGEPLFIPGRTYKRTGDTGGLWEKDHYYKAVTTTSISTRGGHEYRSVSNHSFELQPEKESPEVWVFICEGCETPCYVVNPDADIVPRYCPYGHRECNFKRQQE